jgi:TatD DNase family protein
MKRYINIHSHVIDNEIDTITILNVYPNENIPEKSYFSTGIHPWRINENWEEELKIIEKNLIHPSCLALGECGLDKRIEIPITKQIEVFEAQVKLANQNKKPLILHCVAAFEEVLDILNQQNFTEKVIFHGFSKSEQLAQQILKKGYYISFGKYLLQNENLAEVFKNIPNHSFFLETDNSQYKIEEVYQKASELKNTSIIEMQNIVNENFKNVFKNI